MSLTLASLLNKESEHTLIVFYGQRMLVKRESTSRLAMKNHESWSVISLANSKLYFTVYIMVVIDSGRGTRSLPRLHVVVLIAYIMSLKDGKLSTNYLWTLQRA